MKGRARAPRGAVIIYVLVLAAFYIPLVGLFWGAFVSHEAGVAHFTLQWFGAVLTDPNLMPGLRNSLFVGITSSVVATTLGSFAALGISRFWEGRLLNGFSYISLFLPEIVFALALLAWFFVLQMDLGFTTLIIAHTTLTLSYVILTVLGRIQLLDPALEEAALDLGSRPWQVLRTITLPLLAPAIGSGFILSFLISFDDFLISFFVSGAGQDTLPLKLYSSMKLGLTPKLNALSTLMMVVTLGILFLVFRKSRLRDLIKSDEK